MLARPSWASGSAAPEKCALLISTMGTKDINVSAWPGGELAGRSGFDDDECNCKNLTVLLTLSRPARPWWPKLELRRGPVHMSARLAGNNPAEPFICGPGHQAGQRLLAKGRPSRWECRGSAEARPHTEHGSGLLNDHTNWLRLAPPEPRTAPTRAQRHFVFGESCWQETAKNDRQQENSLLLNFENRG